jgi:hypothetical protein
MSAQDLLIWKEKTRSFADEIKEKAAVLQYVPPIEISPGVTIPGRQGYIDTCMHFEQMLWLCPECEAPLEGGKCKPCELSCPYCSVPMEGDRCKVCEYEDSPLWACGKCDRELENGKCRDCER